jgi:hypothetical protein
MRVTRSLKIRMTLVALLVVIGGCATRGLSGPQVELPVQINSNLIPPASNLTIFLVPSSGIEYQLGTILGSGRHSLIYRGLPPSGTYRLVARADTRQMYSDLIQLDANVKAISWDLQRNYLELSIQER